MGMEKTFLIKIILMSLIFVLAGCGSPNKTSDQLDISFSKTYYIRNPGGSMILIKKKLVEIGEADIRELPESYSYIPYEMQRFCVNGVSYLQFPSGVTVEYTPDGKIKTCK